MPELTTNTRFNHLLNAISSANLSAVESLLTNTTIKIMMDRNERVRIGQRRFPVFRNCLALITDRIIDQKDKAMIDKLLALPCLIGYIETLEIDYFRRALLEKNTYLSECLLNQPKFQEKLNSTPLVKLERYLNLACQMPSEFLVDRLLKLERLKDKAFAIKYTPKLIRDSKGQLNEQIKTTENINLLLACKYSSRDVVAGLLADHKVRQKANIYHNLALRTALHNKRTDIALLVFSLAHVKETLLNTHEKKYKQDLLKAIMMAGEQTLCDSLWEAPQIKETLLSQPAAYLSQAVYAKNKVAALFLLAKPEFIEAFKSSTENELSKVLQQTCAFADSDIFNKLIVLSEVKAVANQKGIEFFKVPLPNGQLQQQQKIITNAALIIALKGGHQAIAESLLNIEPVLQSANGDNNYALKIAIQKKFVVIANTLLRLPKVQQTFASNAPQINSVLFFEAIKAGEIDILNQLLEHQAFEHLFLEQGLNFLTYALQYRQTDIALWFLQSSAIDDLLRQTPVRYLSSLLLAAVDLDNKEILDHLLAYENIQVSAVQPLTWDIIRRNLATSQTPLAHRKDLQNAAFIYAIRLGKQNAINRLLSLPAIKQSAGSDDNQALLLALEYKRSAVIRTLLTYPSVQQGITQAHQEKPIFLMRSLAQQDNAAVLVEDFLQNQRFKQLALQSIEFPLLELIPLLKDENAWQARNREPVNTVAHPLLLLAINYGNKRLVQILVDKIGSMSNEGGYYALKLLFKLNKLEWVALILPHVSLTGVLKKENILIDASQNKQLINSLLDNFELSKKCNAKYLIELLSHAINRNNKALVDKLLHRDGIENHLHRFGNKALKTALANEDSKNATKILNLLLDNNHLTEPHELFKRAIYHGLMDVAYQLMSNSQVIAGVKEDHPNYATCLELGKGLVFYDQSRNIGNIALIRAIKYGHRQMVDALWQYPAIKQNAHANNNMPLFYACKYGDLYSVRLLLGQYFVVTNINQYNLNEKRYGDPLTEAVKNEHMDVVCCLLQVQELDAGKKQNKALRAAVENGSLAMVKCLLEDEKVLQQFKKSPKKILILASDDPQIFNYLIDTYDFIRKGDYKAFDNYPLSRCIINNDMARAERLLKEEKVLKHLAVNNNWLLCKVIDAGNMTLFTRFLQDKSVQKKLTADDNDVLVAAIKKNNADMVERLLSFKKVKTKLGLGDNKALTVTIESRNKALFDRLITEPAVKRQLLQQQKNILEVLCHTIKEPAISERQDIKAMAQSLLEFPAVFNHPQTLILAIKINSRTLFDKQLASQKIQENLKDHPEALISAIKLKRNAMVKRLLALPAVQESLAHADNAVLKTAIKAKSINLFNLILENPSVKSLLNEEAINAPILQLVAQQNRSASSYEKQVLLAMGQRLLALPAIFFHAERHYQEYKAYLEPFIQNKINSFNKRELAYKSSNPDGVFDIESSEAEAYFSIVRFYIRRDEAKHLPLIKKLLALPSLQSMMTYNDNQLLRLAVDVENEEVVDLLLENPEVEKVAAQNKYYQTSRGLGLGALARDRESSLRSLTRTQQKIFTNIQNYYKDKMADAGGVEAVFNGFKAYLANKYLEKPARINIDGQIISLPVDYQAFTSLKIGEPQRGLTLDEKQEALKAYHQHPVHRAIRYLSKPNPWMHRNANYVNRDRNDRGFAWSAFEGYKEDIAYFWLAASDESQMGPQRVQVSDRQELFFKEFSDAARAHNYRQIDAIDANGQHYIEEVDNFNEGDKPSCFSGFKGRIYQAIATIDHPLVPIYCDTALLKQEIKEFVSLHFKELLKHKSFEELQAIDRAYKCYLTTFDKQDGFELLQCLDIGKEKINVFKQQLRKKYDTSFSANLSLRFEFVKAFYLKEDETHFLNFFDSANLKTLLDNCLQESEASIGQEAVKRRRTVVTKTMIDNEIKQFIDDHFDGYFSIQTYQTLCELNKSLRAYNEAPSEASWQKLKVFNIRQEFVDAFKGPQLARKYGGLALQAEPSLVEHIDKVFALKEGQTHLSKFNQAYGLDALLQQYLEAKAPKSSASGFWGNSTKRGPEDDGPSKRQKVLPPQSPSSP